MGICCEILPSGWGIGILIKPNPHLSPTFPGWGEVGLNIDRRISEMHVAYACTRSGSPHNVIHSASNIISISVPHDSFIASVYSFISSCSAFLLLRTVMRLYFVLMGVCRTNLRMRSWWICQRKYVQKKNSRGAARSLMT